jgi:hypothetical protein
MSWTVVDDNGTMQVRASISDSKEMEALIACLQERNKQLKDKEKTDE